MMKILLLDDHPLIIDFIAEQIRKIDSDVLVMTSIAVEQALDILSTHKIDRVVCDLQIKSEKALLFLNIAQNTTSLSWFLAPM